MSCGRHIKNTKSRKGNKKILAAKAEIYGIADRATERYMYEKNVIIIEKFINTLSDDSKAVSMLKDDENAMETAHSIPVKYIIVEFKNKQRLTFAIADSRVFDMIFVADAGTLTYQGKYWMSFKKI